MPAPLKEAEKARFIELWAQENPRHACQWPFGDPKDKMNFRFCGAQALPDKPYCAEHHYRAHNPPEQRAHRRPS